ncbi:MAG TPA: ABC transporter permease [Chloroflexota bacterium]|nr:ABC transporter permease [Chloroflexota bacterium]
MEQKLEQPVLGADHPPSSAPPASAFAAEQVSTSAPPLSLMRKLRRNPLTRHFLLNPLNFFGLVIVIVVLVLAVIGPYITPYSPTVPDYTSMLSGPTGAHWFGTDFIGKDVFSRILAGARYSLGTAAAVLGIAVTLGLTLGAISGFFGGWVDELIMRVTDMFLAFPALILALAVANTLGAGLQSAVIALAVGFWPWYTRLLRGQVLSLKNREYVEAARSLGVSNAAIMWRHILPNALSPIIVELSMDMGYAVLDISALSYIGLGAQPPSPEWGAMIVAGKDYLRTAWWVCAFPGIALSLTILGFNVVGDALRDVLDPRSAAHHG